MALVLGALLTLSVLALTVATALLLSYRRESAFWEEHSDKYKEAVKHWRTKWLAQHAEMNATLLRAGRQEYVNAELRLQLKGEELVHASQVEVLSRHIDDLRFQLGDVELPFLDPTARVEEFFAPRTFRVDFRIPEFRYSVGFSGSLKRISKRVVLDACARSVETVSRKLLAATADALSNSSDPTKTVTQEDMDYLRGVYAKHGLPTVCKNGSVRQEVTALVNRKRLVEKFLESIKKEDICAV